MCMDVYIFEKEEWDIILCFVKAVISIFEEFDLTWGTKT